MCRGLILFFLCLGEIYANLNESDFEIDNRIVGGTRCSIKDHPFMVAILHIPSHTFKCGASLISSTWVLSARHCMESYYEAKSFMIVAGSEIPYKQNWTKNVQLSVVKRYYRHPFADIGLMHLNTPITLSETVGYVKLATKLDLLDKKLEDICANCTIMGWGEQVGISLDNQPIPETIKGPFDPYIQCLQTSAISPLACYMKLKHITRKNVSDWNFCGYKKSTDACMGDSGGPLMCNGTQFGVISSGYGCAFKEYPGLYVKVFHFNDFINSTIAEANASDNTTIPDDLECSIRAYSYMVAIIHRKSTQNYQFICTGSLLTQTWVLTVTACTIHCKIPKYYTVVAGLDNSLTFNPDRKHTPWSEVSYCSQPPNSKLHDISLMKLNKGFNFEKEISFAPIATPSAVKNKKFNDICNGGRIIGYGRENYRRQQNVQCATVSVISRNKCKNIWKFTEKEKQYDCLDALDSQTCFGELGGPLLCNGSLYAVLASSACSGRRVPTPVLIVKVYEYDKFLKKTINFSEIYYPNDKKSNANLNFSANLYNIPMLYIILFIIQIL